MRRFLLSLLLLGVTGFASRSWGDTVVVTTVAGSPQSVGPVDGVGSAARLAAGKLARDKAGNIYFVQGSAIRRLAPSGAVTTVAGAVDQNGYVDGPASVARFDGLGAIAVDTAGAVYVSDYNNSAIRKLSADGVVSTVVRGSDFAPIGALAVDSSGNVFFLRSGSLLKVTPAGAVSLVFAGGPSSDPTVPGSFYGEDLALDTAGNAVVTDGSATTVRRISPAGAATLVAGQYNRRAIIDGVGGAAAFKGPGSVAIDPAGNIWVTDEKTLRRITPDGTVTTMAGQSEAPWLVAAGGADGVGGLARFGGLGGLACDADGNVFIADGWFGGGMIRRATPSNAPAPPILSTTPALESYSRYVGAGAAVTFTSVAVGAQPMAFQWQRNGVAIPGATRSTFTLTAASTTDEGAYTVTVSNGAGAYTSIASTLRVFAPAFEAFTTRRTVAGGSFLWGITSGGGQLVAVGDRGRILTSPDGATWTIRDAGSSAWLLGVAYGSGKYAVVGDHGLILRSIDAVTWTPVTNTGTTQRLNNVAYGNGLFVAVGEGGAIVTSPDGVTWTAETSGVTTWLRGVVWVPEVSKGSFSGDNGTGRFYAAGQNGELLERRATGWIPTSGGGSLRYDIEALTDKPVGIGADGALTSLNSSIFFSKIAGYGYYAYYWVPERLGLAARFRGLASGAGALFAMGENGTIAAAPDAHGPWSFIPSGTTANLVSGVFHGNSLFVVGENETILQSHPLYVSRLNNIATRGLVGPGDATMIGGFVVRGTAPKTVLVRAAGPALATFGVAGALAAPVLTLFDGASHPIATNRGWGTASDPDAVTAASARVGAFPFAAGSADSALLLTLAPGAYTAQVTSAAGTAGGVTLLEAYDADVAAGGNGSRAVNLSTRGQVGVGENRLIVGFVVNGATSRRVLIRGVGPSLAQYGLSGVLAQPQLELYDSRGARLQSAGAWGDAPNPDEIAAATTIAGAFALPAGGKDAALVTTLPPGNYTVQVSGVGNSTGLAIVEVYDLP